MTVFWLVASLLVAAALALLLPPLLRHRAAPAGVSRKAINVAVYRDQLRELEQDFAGGAVSRDDYEEARRELERRLLDDVSATRAGERAGSAGRNAAVIVGAAIPLVAFALYFSVGNFGVLLPGRADSAEQAAHSISEAQIRELAGRLAARMEKEPDNIEGWVMLGRSYTALGEFENAARAYGNAVARSGSDAALLADYADALAMAQGRSLEGEPEKLIHRALAIDPQNVKALALAGTVAFERKDYAGATQYWERILKIAPEDSEFAKSVRASIAEAQELGRQSGGSAHRGQCIARGSRRGAGSDEVCERRRSACPRAGQSYCAGRHALRLRAGRRRLAHAARRYPRARERPAIDFHAGRPQRHGAGHDAFQPGARCHRRANFEVGKRNAAARRSRRLKRTDRGWKVRHRRRHQYRDEITFSLSRLAGPRVGFYDGRMMVPVPIARAA